MAAEDKDDMKEWAKSRGKSAEDEDDEDEPKSDAPDTDDVGEEAEEDGEDSGSSMSSEELDELVELVRADLDQILEAVSIVDAESFIATDEELDDDAADQVLRDLESMSPELADELEGISEEDAAAVGMQVREDVAEKLGEADEGEVDQKTALVAAFLFRAGELV